MSPAARLPRPTRSRATACSRPVADKHTQMSTQRGTPSNLPLRLAPREALARLSDFQMTVSHLGPSPKTWQLARGRYQPPGRNASLSTSNDDSRLPSSPRPASPTPRKRCPYPLSPFEDRESAPLRRDHPEVSRLSSEPTLGFPSLEVDPLLSNPQTLARKTPSRANKSGVQVSVATRACRPILSPRVLTQAETQAKLRREDRPSDQVPVFGLRPRSETETSTPRSPSRDSDDRWRKALVELQQKAGDPIERDPRASSDPDRLEDATCSRASTLRLSPKTAATERAATRLLIEPDCLTSL